MEKKKIRIFISSPGDVYQERITAKKVIAELNKIYSKHLEIEPILWEDMPLLASSTFQDGIDEIIKQYNIDIAVFILWSRLGTPLNNSYLKKDGSLYQSGTEYELDLMLQSFEKSGRPRILVYVKNEPLKNRLVYESEENLQEVISQHHAVKTFIKEHFHDEESGSNYAYTSFGGNVSFESRLKSHLKGIIADYLGNKMTLIKWHKNPYVGLNSFDYTESDIFFGRERAVNDIMANVLTYLGEGCMPSIVLLGESGSGKSSLVQAGVVPMMDYIEDNKGILLKVIPSLMGEKIYDSFVEMFLSAYPFIQETPIADELRKGINEDYNFAHLQYALSKAQSRECPIFFLDQFEELFSDARILDDQRILFLRLIKGLVGTRSVFIVLSMRNDFYNYFHLYKDFNLVKETATLVYDMPLLGSSEYASIIKEPAKLAGIEWEVNSNGQALDELIINDAIELKSLPLIQFSLYELYKIKNKENIISYESYQSIGGIKGAFLMYANSIYEQLSDGEALAFNDILSKTIAISNLESETFVRKTSLLKDVEISDVHRFLIKKLVDAHILVSSKNSNGEPTITLVHEMLIHSWPVIAQWIESERYFLKESGYYEKRALQWIESGAKSSGVIKDEEQLLRVEYFDYWWATKTTKHVRNYIKASLDYRRKLGITRWSIYILAYSWLAYAALLEYNLLSINGVTSFLGVLLLFVPLCLNLVLHITKKQTYKTVKAQFVTWLSFLILNVIIEVLDRNINPQDYLDTSGMWLNYLLYIIFFCATLSSYQQYKVRSSWKNRKFKIPLTIKIFNKEGYKIASTFLNSLFVVLFILGIIFGWHGLILSNKFDSTVVMCDYLTQTLEHSNDELSTSFFYDFNELREVYLKEVYYDSVDVISYPNSRKEELARTFYYRSMPDSALLYLSNDTSDNANFLRAKIYSQLGSYKEASNSLNYSPEVLCSLLQSSVIMGPLEPVSIYIMGGAFQEAKEYLNYLETNIVDTKDVIFPYCNALYSVAKNKGGDTFYNYMEMAKRDTIPYIPVCKLLMSGILSSTDLILLQEKCEFETLIEKKENVPDNFLGEWYAVFQASEYEMFSVVLAINEQNVLTKIIQASAIDGSSIKDASNDLIRENIIHHSASPVLFNSKDSCIIAISANLFEPINYNSTIIINVGDYSDDSFNANNINCGEFLLDSLVFKRVQL